MFFDAAQIGYEYVSVVIIPRIWTVWVAAYVCTKERYRTSWDSSLTPPELADEPTWRHNIWIILIVNINQSPILDLYRLCRSLIKWISSHICPANLWDVGPICNAGFPLDLRRKRISRKNPRPPRPTTLDPRLHFFYCFFYSLFIKFGKQYQVNVGSPSATLA